MWRWKYNPFRMFIVGIFGTYYWDRLLPANGYQPALGGCPDQAIEAVNQVPFDFHRLLYYTEVDILKNLPLTAAALGLVVLVANSNIIQIYRETKEI